MFFGTGVPVGDPERHTTRTFWSVEADESYRNILATLTNEDLSEGFRKPNAWKYKLENPLHEITTGAANSMPRGQRSSRH